MFRAVFGSFLLAAFAKAIPLSHQNADKIDGTIQYLPVNGGWNNFPFGDVGSVTPVMFNLFCPGVMNITDLWCSGDQFSIYDNGVFLGNTSSAVYNECQSNSTHPDYTQQSANWSHGSYDLLPGWHNISIIPIVSPYREGVGAIRVDSFKHGEHHHHEHHHHHHHHKVPCSLDICPIKKDEMVIVKTPVPRCQAEAVCQSLGMHLAHIDIQNFLDATTQAFQCSGANSQSWIDDWNGDEYQGSCLVLSTGSAAPGGAINVPSCCSAHLPVICQKKPCHHPSVQYHCNECQKSCHCDHQKKCHRCHHGKCEHVEHCGLLRPVQ